MYNKLAKSYHVIKKHSSYTRLDFEIHVLNENSYFINVKNGTQLLFTITDEKESASYMFKRSIYMNEKEYIYYIDNNDIKCFFRSNKTNLSINIIDPQPYFEPKILTLDIETILVNGEHIPLCIAIFEGELCSYTLFDKDDCTLYSIHSTCGSITRNITENEFYTVYFSIPEI